ncbi:hypothetical protein GQ457_18G006670 [Hibiscus cannabinus]
MIQEPLESCKTFPIQPLLEDGETTTYAFKHIIPVVTIANRVVVSTTALETKCPNVCNRCCRQEFPRGEHGTLEIVHPKTGVELQRDCSDEEVNRREGGEEEECFSQKTEPIKPLKIHTDFLQKDNTRADVSTTRITRTGQTAAATCA